MGSHESSATGDTETSGDGARLSWWWLILFLGGVIAIWIVAWICTWTLIDKPADRSAFGDMFGSVNSLFAGLAFGGLLFAILLQGKELQLQREELKEALVQYRRQADQLEGQTKTVSKQRFEDTFFRVLDILKKQVAEVTTQTQASSEQVTGYDALACIYSQFKTSYNQFLEEEQPSGYSRHQNALTSILRRHPQLLNYFGTLVHTLSLLDDSDIPKKMFYGTFLSAQLRRHEKLLLFYYALLPGIEDTKRRIENYAVLYAIDKSDLIEPSHAAFYDHRAWTPVNERERLGAGETRGQA